MTFDLAALHKIIIMLAHSQIIILLFCVAMESTLGKIRRILSEAETWEQHYNQALQQKYMCWLCIDREACMHAVFRTFLQTYS